VQDSLGVALSRIAHEQGICLKPGAKRVFDQFRPFDADRFAFARSGPAQRRAEEL
jgi:hypothetical protein